MTKEMYHLMDHKAYKVYKNIYVCLYTYTQNNSKDNQLLLFRSCYHLFLSLVALRTTKKKKSVVKPTHPYLTMILLILPVFPIFFFILMLSAV